MIEIPEAQTLAGQINASLSGKRIIQVRAGHTPHKFAWYHGDPRAYPLLLKGQAFRQAGIHPKKKTASLSETDRRSLYQAVKTTLAEMASHGGRDTETDLYGHPGGYPTKLIRPDGRVLAADRPF